MNGRFLTLSHASRRSSAAVCRTWTIYRANPSIVNCLAELTVYVEQGRSAARLLFRRLKPDAELTQV